MVSSSTLVLLPSEKGRGVYTLDDIPEGSPILEFAGPRVDRGHVLTALRTTGHDGFLQIDHDEFIGLSGGFDDFINHSCDPNCGLNFDGDAPRLISLEYIPEGSELTFDYACSQENFPFRFACSCGAPDCRRIVGDFRELPAKIRARYLRMGLVPPFLSEELHVEMPRLAVGAK
ncbi:MAG: SET domain-containing protein-lysine N-methyltransferase [Bdellovibrionales bacterium]|nr:SET domain-containing protein-lysine N-methyltransferase [Bdellovibrionales bacterium]